MSPVRRGRSELSVGRPSLGPMTAMVHDGPRLPAPTDAGDRGRRRRPAVPRCPRAARPTSRPARCSTASARSTGCPSARASPPSAARSCTPCSRGSTTSRRPSGPSPAPWSWSSRPGPSCARSPASPSCSRAAQDDGAETDANAPESVRGVADLGREAGREVLHPRGPDAHPAGGPRGAGRGHPARRPAAARLRRPARRRARTARCGWSTTRPASMPREAFEAKALFQMKFYALVLWRTRGVVAAQLKLLYLGTATRSPTPPTRRSCVRFERTLLAIWAAIERAVSTGDFRPEQDPAVRLVRPPGALPGVRRHSPAVPDRGGGGGRLADAADRRARLSAGPARSRFTVPPSCGPAARGWRRRGRRGGRSPR